MPTPAVTRAPRYYPDHYDEHVRLAQAVDWERPRGIIAYKMGTVTSGAISSATATVQQLTNVAFKAGRLYLVSFALRATATTTSGTYIRPLVYIGGTGGTLLGASHNYLPANASWQFHTFAYLYAPAADLTTTVDLRLDSPANPTYWNDRGGHLKVEDIGPDRGRQ